MRTYESVLDVIGRTPLLRLRTGFPPDDPRAYVKVEFLNPTGSVKTLMALTLDSDSVY